MGGGGSFEALLAGLPARRMRRRLVRCVPQLDFMAGDPPRFLYTSGRPNRCNPRGVDCLYFSEDERTADAEYRRQWRGTDAETQPKLTIFARVDLRRIIDLENEQVIHALGLRDDDLFGSWRLSTELTRLQRLGLAISRQRSVAAVRFPSAALGASRQKGWNLAIFRLSLESPSRVEILGKSGDPLEMLP
jgi:RES domain-containing protein